METKKQQAIDLRKTGKSYSQIGNELEIPKSTLSLWLSEIKISKRAQALIDKRAYKKSTDALVKRNKQQTKLAQERAEVIRVAAKKEFLELSKDKMFLAGICLYWAEGYKKGAYGSKWKCVDFANSDPEMIMLLMRFFCEKCGIEMSKI